MATTGAKGSKDDDAAQAEAQTMNADIQQLREDIARLTEHLRQTGNRSMSRARQAAQEGADQFRGSAEEVQHDLTEAVREKPLTALALAAGVGFLFAMMTRR